jgi:two-component system cell cycle sensor histidine kinase PleC
MKLLARHLQEKRGEFDLYRWGQDNVLVAPGVANATFVGPDGRLRSTTLMRDAKPTDLSDRAHFRVFLEPDPPETFIGRSVLGRDSGKIILPIARRINAEDGSFLGVLFVLIDPGALAGMQKSVNLGPGGIITLTGTDRVIRARYSKDSPDGTKGVNDSIARGQRQSVLPENGEAGRLGKSMIDGITRVYTHGRVGTYPLVVTVGLDLDHELAIAKSHAETVVMVAFAATFLLAGLAVYLVRESHIRVARESDLAEEHNKLQRANMALLDSKTRAEEANRAKSLFLANMSHELRTPLNAIIGYSQVIRDQMLGADAQPRYREYAGDVAQSGEHLLRLINDILDTAKIDAGKLELAEEPVSLPEIISASLKQLQLAIERKRLRIELGVPPDLPVLRADEGRLMQVMMNLLSNAIKFTPEGGRIAIAAERSAGGDLVWSVSDTGIGMSAEEIAIALEPFAQVDNGMTKNYEGTGLGLPLAKRLVQLHDGTLISKARRAAARQ